VFFELGGQQYLRDLLPGPISKDGIGEREVAFLFDHNCDQKPYIAVHVDEFGITNIAFTLKAGVPNWVRSHDKQQTSEFFQDTGDEYSYNSVFVISNASKPNH
jgi:hypothetical protein